MTVPLLDFLRARVTEDIAAVNELVTYDDADMRPVDDVHMRVRRWTYTTDRLVADLEAKRALIELHEVHKEVPAPGRAPWFWCRACDEDRDYGYISDLQEGCETVRILAATYAHHPDYDPAWSPA